MTHPFKPGDVIEKDFGEWGGWSRGRVVSTYWMGDYCPCVYVKVHGCEQLGSWSCHRMRAVSAVDRLGELADG